MIQPFKSAISIRPAIRVSTQYVLLLIILFLTLLISAINGYARARIFERLHCMQIPAEARSGVAIKVADIPSLERQYAAKEIDAFTTDYEQLQAQIRQSGPRYAALTEPAPLSLIQIQIFFFQKDLPEWKKIPRLVSKHDVALV